MKISVVLPAFNAEVTIARAVQSILSQTLSEFELIVVNDGSTDGTADIVQQISDDRIKLVNCEHQGIVAAANLGTSIAKSPHIARMDADDFSYPHRLAAELQLLLSDDLDAVGCQVQILDERGKPVPSMQRYEQWINSETLQTQSISALRFVEFPLVNPTILARREYFELGFLDNGYPEDYDLMLRAAARGMKFGKVPDVLFDWSDCPDGLTRTHERYTETAFLHCRRHYLLAGPLVGHDVVDIWGLGKAGKPWQRWLQWQGLKVRRAYDVAERRVGETIHGVVVEHTDDLHQADGTPLIIAVGAANARSDIRPQIATKQFRVGVDAWFVA